MPCPDHVHCSHINSWHPTAPDARRPTIQISGAWQSIDAQQAVTPPPGPQLPHISPCPPRATRERNDAQHLTGHMASPHRLIKPPKGPRVRRRAAPGDGQRSGGAQLFTLLCFYRCAFLQPVKSSVQSTGLVCERQPRSRPSVPAHISGGDGVLLVSATHAWLLTRRDVHLEGSWHHVPTLRGDQGPGERRCCPFQVRERDPRLRAELQMTPSFGVFFFFFLWEENVTKPVALMPTRQSPSPLLQAE